VTVTDACRNPTEAEAEFGTSWSGELGQRRRQAPLLICVPFIDPAG